MIPKIRAWVLNMTPHYMIEVSDLNFELGYVWGSENFEEHLEGNPLNEVILMSSTTKVDRNKKDIFESDRVRFRTDCYPEDIWFEGVIIWQNCSWKIRRETKDGRILFYNLECFGDDEVEVIGNIYEGKED